MTIENFSSRRDLVARLEKAKKQDSANELVRVHFAGYDKPLQVYPASVRKHPRGGVFLAGKFNGREALFILGRESIRVMKEYDGNTILRHSDFSVKKCRWTRGIAEKIRKDFPVFAPSSEKKGQVSLSFSDILGLGGNAQLRIFKGRADLAFSRQCAHQLEQLDIHPLDAIDAITRTIFQEGYEEGYFAEACHITTPDELLTMLNAGYTRFSLEPSGPTLFSAREKPKKELLASMFELPWIELRDKFELMFNRYKGNRIDLEPVRFSDDEEQQDQEMVRIMPNEAEILAAIRMLGGIIIQVEQMEKVLVDEGRRDEVILEVSFARSEGTLTPFELYFLVTELLRHDVRVDYVAPGDLEAGHWAVANNTRLTGLSGGLSHLDNIRLEASGLRFHGVVEDISYFTAMQCIAENDAGLFRQIWTHSRNVLEQVKEESGLDLNIQHFPSHKEYADEDLPKLLEKEHAGLFLDYTMTEVFTKKDDQGRRYLRTAVFDFLRKYESEYMDALAIRYQEIINRRA